MDIAEAQRALGRFGKLDRIDVTVGAGEDLGVVERAARGALPEGYLVRRPGTRSEENQRMLRAFRWNLRVLSYISLVVGARPNSRSSASAARRISVTCVRVWRESGLNAGPADEYALTVETGRQHLPTADDGWVLEHLACPPASALDAVDGPQSRSSSRHPARAVTTAPHRGDRG